AGLQHAIRREADSRHNVGGREGSLFDFGEEVVRITVQFQYPDLDERVIALGPDLGQVEGIQMIRTGFLLRHDLNVHLPAGEVAALNRVEQVTLRAFAVAANYFLCFSVRQVLDALLGAEMELHPKALVLCVDEAERVTAEQVHVTEAGGNAAIAHHDGDLVQGFGQAGPEFPVVLGTAHTGARVALHGVVQVRELERVTEEEHGRVVTDQVPVAFFGVKLHGDAADVALGIRRAALASHRGEASEHGRLLAYFREDLGASVLGDVVGDREGAIRSRA